MLWLAGRSLGRRSAMFFSTFELLIPLVVLGLIVMAIAAFSSDRREPDPSGRRPYAVYLFSISFVTLFVVLFASIAVISSIVRIALPEDRIGVEAVTYGPGGVTSSQTVAPVPVPVPVSPGQETPILSPNPAPLEIQRFDPNKEHIRDAVRWGLVGVAAGLVLLFHAGRAKELVLDPGFAEGPARRTYHVYLYAVCFVAILTSLVAGAVAAYGLFRIIAPGTTGFGSNGLERDDGIVQLVSAGVLALAALAIFAFHWRRVSMRAATASEPPTAA
jgi:hypothetical protein